MINKNYLYKFYLLFLSLHLIIWTLVPSLTNENLPLDTIEALAWGSNLDWGFNKHPPFSAFAVEIFYQIFGNKDWAYYLLSQIFVLTAFILVFKFAYDFFDNFNFAFLSIILLEGIFFYNYTTPEFNVNISQLPFWASAIYFSWRCIKNEKTFDYILLGFFMGLGFLSKYLFLYLILGIKFLFIYLIIKKKIKSLNFLLVGPVALITIFPHLIWLFQNDFITLNYGFQRAGLEQNNFSDHLILPFLFITKQIGILIPFFVMGFFLLKKINPKITYDKKSIFLIFTFIIPIILIILTSIIMGIKIRTMWMTPFYLIAGVVFIQLFKKNINLKKLNKFFFVFFIFFALSPLTYIGVSVSNDFKRTDYEGKEIARLVQNKWDDNFTNEIKVVVGDEWFAGNLSYHLNSRPRWIIELTKNDTIKLKDDEGVIYTGNPKILKKICPGVYGTIKPVGYCMIGRK